MKFSTLEALAPWPPTGARAQVHHDVECIVLPPRSPNLHAYAERWVRSVKDEALSWLMLFDEGSLQHVLHAYVDHYHQERNHQGKGNSLLFPPPRSEGAADGPMQCRERRGGLL